MKKENCMTYEAPVITKIGKAEEVILGVTDLGSDVDGQMFIPEFEFLGDEDTDSVINRTKV